ncbi:MAG: isoprenyl transferase [bacterium]|nr:isoprenyl transferase [bacterium]
MKNQVLANGNLPRHIAIIMDGNGRWAKKRLQPRIMGHRAGRKAVKRTVEAAAELGVDCLTLYTFSTENWKRPTDEVDALLAFLAEVLESEFLRLAENNIRLVSMGRLHNLPDVVLKTLERTQAQLADNTGMVLNLALSYSGHCEIVDAARAFAEKVKTGEAAISDLDAASFEQYLYRPELPPVDLLIRTSGEQRLSNFCLWQLAYSEIHNSAKLWPDFKAEDLYKAILDYQGRERRFGKLC